MAVHTIPNESSTQWRAPHESRAVNNSLPAVSLAYDGTAIRILALGGRFEAQRQNSRIVDSTEAIQKRGCGSCADRHQLDMRMAMQEKTHLATAS